MASFSRWIGRARNFCRVDSATIALTIASLVGPTVRIIAASTISSITARQNHSAVATPATAIAIGMDCCTVTLELPRLREF